jgi:hypothetical protein
MQRTNENHGSFRLDIWPGMTLIFAAGKCLALNYRLSVVQAGFDREFLRILLGSYSALNIMFKLIDSEILFGNYKFEQIAD